MYFMGLLPVEWLGPKKTNRYGLRDEEYLRLKILTGMLTDIECKKITGFLPARSGEDPVFYSCAFLWQTDTS